MHVLPQSSGGDGRGPRRGEQLRKRHPNHVMVRPRTTAMYEDWTVKSSICSSFDNGDGVVGPTQSARASAKNSYAIEPGGQGRKLRGSALHAQKNHSPRVVDLCGSLPNPACLQVHDATALPHGHLPAAFGTTAAEGVSISPFPTLRASSDITIVFINQGATSAPGGFN